MKNAVVVILSFFLFGCTRKANEQQSSAPTDSTTVAIARNAFIYSLPLVIMDITRRQANDSANNLYSPVNTFRHRSDFPDASFRSVVRPNADTYYSTAFLDLTNEPVVLSLPDTKGRYYMMPMLDAYTNVFASPGSRTTGTGQKVLVITGPQWQGTVPGSMTEIKAPTNTAWIIGRTQVNSKQDGIDVVVPLQKKYKLSPLSAFGKAYTAPKSAEESPIKGSPNEIVATMPVDEYYNYVNRLLAKNPPPDADNSSLEEFASIGIRPGGHFTLGSFNTDVQGRLKKIPAEIIAEMYDRMKNRGPLQNGWNPIVGKQGSYGTDYEQRAFISVIGLGANLREDAMYPSTSFDGNGDPLVGVNRYVIHFEKDRTPPANAFWSITLYDSQGYFVDNPINRYTLGDRSRLKHSHDGSVDIYIQHESPGVDRQDNWLPAPTGEFNLVMRVYWPKEEMINGTWRPTAVMKVD